jgi:hypothetical protein
MDGRAFLDVARELVQGPSEAHWRAAASRAYYALMLEGRTALERWGFSLPPQHQIHAFVRLRFLYAPDSDLKDVGYALERLGSLRNRADYHLTAPAHFASKSHAAQAVHEAEVNVARPDRLEGDPARRAAAIAAIRASGT